MLHIIIHIVVATFPVLLCPFKVVNISPCARALSPTLLFLLELFPRLSFKPLSDVQTVMPGVTAGRMEYRSLKSALYYYRLLLWNIQMPFKVAERSDGWLFSEISKCHSVADERWDCVKAFC